MFMKGVLNINHKSQLAPSGSNKPIKVGKVNKNITTKNISADVNFYQFPYYVIMLQMEVTSTAR